MIPRPLLVTLVFALPILVMTIGVVLAASALAGAVGDLPTQRGLAWLAIAALVLLVIDALLLLAALGMRALMEREEREE